MDGHRVSYLVGSISVDDPFRPKSDQLVREAKIGLIIVGLLVGLFCYVTWNRFSGNWDRLPAHVLDAPVAKNMNEQFREDRRHELAQLDRRLEQFAARNQRPSATIPQSPQNTAAAQDNGTFTRGTPSPALERSSVTVSKRTENNSTPISFNDLRSSSPTQDQAVQPVGFEEETAVPSKQKFDDPFGPASQTSKASATPKTDQDFQPRQSSFQPLSNQRPQKLLPEEASQFQPQKNTEAKIKSTDSSSRPIRDNHEFAPLTRRDSGSSFAPRVFAQRTRFQVEVEGAPEPNLETTDVAVPSQPQSQQATSPNPSQLAKRTNPIETLQPTTVSPLPGQYTVQNADESLWGIAAEAYGDGRLFRALYEANRPQIPDPNRLAPGTELRVPGIETLLAEFRQHVPADLLPLEEHSPGIYITQQGDSLFQVAGQQLGQASRFNELLKLNQSSLPLDITHLSPLPVGMRLKLPTDIE